MQAVQIKVLAATIHNPPRVKVIGYHGHYVTGFTKHKPIKPQFASAVEGYMLKFDLSMCPFGVEVCQLPKGREGYDAVCLIGDAT